jgi:hypothetical protein
MSPSNIVFEWGVPRTVQGYWDMGSIQIPPLPELLVLSDRGYSDLGLAPKLWLIEFKLDGTLDPTHPVPRIGITDVIPQRLIGPKGQLDFASDVQVYDDAYNGPVVGVDTVNATQDFLFVRTGTKVLAGQTVPDTTQTRLGIDRRPIPKQSGIVTSAHRGDQGTGQSLFIRVSGNSRQYVNLYTNAAGRTAYTDAQTIPSNQALYNAGAAADLD